MALMFLQDAKVLAWRNPVCGAQQLEVMATFSERLLEADVLVRAVTGKVGVYSPSSVGSAFINITGGPFPTPIGSDFEAMVGYPQLVPGY
jgi:hypothetical protein